MKSNEEVKFTKKNSEDFYSVLRKRVKSYFRDHNIPTYGNNIQWVKSGFIIAFYVLSYVLMLISGIASNLGLFLFFAAINGFVTPLIVFNIAHDAVHGTFSGSKRVNRWMGLGFCFIGVNDYVWKVKHNVAHHVYTNIPHRDYDIEHDPFLRTSPVQKLNRIHRFQHIYVFLLYPFITLVWIFGSDFEMFFSYGLGRHDGRESFKKERLRFFFYKFLYCCLFLVLPLLLVNLPWYYVLLGFLVLHVIAGNFLGFIVQLGHIVEDTVYPVPDASGAIATSWAAHQLYTTANFACKSSFVTHLVGGSNFQIEHHLFPNISTIHLKTISPIVKQTAKEFGLPYIEKPSVISALRSHIRQLKWFGSEASVLKSVKNF